MVRFRLPSPGSPGGSHWTRHGDRRYVRHYPLIGPATQAIDGRGLTITPGFIDTHSHRLFANEAVSTNGGVCTIPDVLEALAARKKLPPALGAQGVKDARCYDDPGVVARTEIF